MRISITKSNCKAYFITRIEEFLNENGRQIIGWDEILEGGLAPNATVMSWRGTQGGIEAAKQHHNVVMTPGSHLYFDYYQGVPETEPLAIGGFSPLKEVYSFNPIPDELSEKEANFVMGAQGQCVDGIHADGRQGRVHGLPARFGAVGSHLVTKIETQLDGFLASPATAF
ncbi:MAG: family 20 glycosylhydrolase [Fodinibius sp.]|nr:family 20 glycosylhydrolase [Fodinibius sp.]